MFDTSGVGSGEVIPHWCTHVPTGRFLSLAGDASLFLPSSVMEGLVFDATGRLCPKADSFRDRAAFTLPFLLVLQLPASPTAASVLYLP